jgi:hypothetical protein
MLKASHRILQGKLMFGPGDNREIFTASILSSVTFPSPFPFSCQCLQRKGKLTLLSRVYYQNEGKLRFLFKKITYPNCNFLLNYPIAHFLPIKQLIASRLQVGQFPDTQIEDIHQRHFSLVVKFWQI